MQKSRFVFLAVQLSYPLHKVRDELNINVESGANYTNEHLKKLNKLIKKPIKVTYIRRVLIHDKPNKLRCYYPIRNVAEK